MILKWLNLKSPLDGVVELMLLSSTSSVMCLLVMCLS